MKIAVIYYSRHHENTKKVLEGMAEGHEEEISLVDVTSHEIPDLADYDAIGFASGIYSGKFHESVMDCAEKYLSAWQKTFLIYTCGAPSRRYTSAMTDLLHEKKTDILGEFGCRGFDTFGPFQIIGGINRKHPNAKDLQNAQNFYREIREKVQQ